MSDNIIEEHKKMVVMSGKISDFQLNNLKHYPFIILGDYIKNIKIDYSFTKSGSGVESDDLKTEEVYAGEIRYDFSFNKEPEYTEEELTNRLDQLISWVKHLFWTDTAVKFYKDGKKWVI